MLWLGAGAPAAEAGPGRDAKSGFGRDLTLRGALAAVYQGNPQLAADRARQRADDEGVPRALGGYDPQINATATFGPTVDRQGGDRKTRITQPVAAGIVAAAPILDFGRTAAAVSGAESLVLAGREDLRGTEQTVLLSGVTAFMDVLRDRATLELQRRNVDVLLEVERVTRRRVETGDTRPTDLSQAEARVARARSDVARAEADLVGSRATFRQVVGQEANGLSFPEPATRLPATLREAVAEGRAHGPSVRNAIHLVDVAAVAVTAARAELSPRIASESGLSRTFGRSGDRNGVAPISAGLSATVPFYDGGAVPALVRQAKESLAQRRIELEVARSQVETDVRTAWGVLLSAREAVPAAEAGIAANEVALAGVRREEIEGQRTTLDVLNASQELLNAQTALVRARRDRVVASYGLLAAVGHLTAARLDLPGERYRPETHYRQVVTGRPGRRTPDGR